LRADNITPEISQNPI